MTAPATIAVSALPPTTTPVLLLTDACAAQACAPAAQPDRRDAVHHRVAGIAGGRDRMPAAPTAGSRKAVR